MGANNQNFGSIHQNSVINSYHNIVNTTIQFGVYYHTRITVSEYGKTYIMFLFSEYVIYRGKFGTI